MNAQNRKQIIIAGALVVVLIVVGVYQVFIAGGAPPSAPAVQTTKAPQTTPARAPAPQPTMLVTADIDPEALLREVEVVPFDYDLHRIDRNPMTPLIGQVTGPRAPMYTPGATTRTVEVLQKRVSGIMWDEREPMAVVDNEVVVPGHVYPDGVLVHSIEPNRVVFKVGDSYYPVPIKEL